MSKGFFFSIDALLALALIVSAGLAFLLLFQEADSELLVLQLKKTAASDDAMVGFYLKSPQNFSGPVLDNNKTIYCVKDYNYNLSNGLVLSTDFCEGNS